MPWATLFSAQVCGVCAHVCVSTCALYPFEFFFVGSTVFSKHEWFLCVRVLKCPACMVCQLPRQLTCPCSLILALAALYCVQNICEVNLAHFAHTLPESKSIIELVKSVYSNTYTRMLLGQLCVLQACLCPSHACACSYTHACTHARTHTHTAGLDSHVNVWDLKMMASSAASGTRPSIGPLASILVEPTPDTPIFKVAYANSPRPTLAAFASTTVSVCVIASVCSLPLCRTARVYL